MHVADIEMRYSLLIQRSNTDAVQAIKIQTEVAGFTKDSPMQSTPYYLIQNHTAFTIHIQLIFVGL